MFGFAEESAMQEEKIDGYLAHTRLIETIVDASADYICAVDREERIIIFNEKYVKLTGLEKADALGKPVTAIFPHIVNTEVHEAFRRALKGEFVHRRKYHSSFTEKYYETRYIPLKDIKGNIYGALLIGHDIDDKVKVEEDLLKANKQIARNEEMYHRMINEVEDYAILLLSPDGNIENWNKGAEKIKGYKLSEIIGKNFRIFYTQKDREDGLPERLLEKARVNGKSNHEGWRVRKDGSVFWGSVVLTALHNDANEVTGFTKVTRDLTAQKITQDQLKVSADRLALKNKELERSNNELTSFSYVASHDLQEPLRKIKTFGKLILEKDGANFSESGRDYFNRMVNAADRMKSLMDALLEFSRVNTEKRELESTDLNMLVDEVKKDLGELIDINKATVDVEQLTKMEVIPFQFKQVIHNLISNSLKYAREGVAPVINISGKKIKADDIHDTRARGKEYFELTLTDNGIGFPMEDSEKIFELFQRLHGKSEYSGSGIGLSICKKIADNHGGFIKAEGRPGIGASFHLFSPIAKSGQV